MASVTSLDKDLRKLRLEKYTPAAADEARRWIEDTLGEKLPSPDLLEGLKDGVALCKLINLAVPSPGVRFKKSAMPFVQMENISQFLGACQAPPLSLHQHDTFLTVDLFEQKDPAQVLQCIGAFSRVAHAANPSRFPDPIGPKTRPVGLAPQLSGGDRTRNRGASFASDASSGYGGRSTVSQDSASWGRKDKEAAAAAANMNPAWNIAQYGFMGGASQGNLGISFGSRRQVTSTDPTVPSLADKERARKEKIAEEERARQEEEERRRQILLAEERQIQQQEDRLFEEKASRLREQERLKSEGERRQWEEQERQWKLAEEKRREEELQAAARAEEERLRNRTRSPPKLHGQFLSQYQAEQATAVVAEAGVGGGDDKARIRELETELELARQREAEYERDRQGRSGPASASDVSAKLSATSPTPSRSRPITPRSPNASNSSQLSRHESWSQGGELLHTKWHQRQQDLSEDEHKHSGGPFLSSPKSPRPLPDPKALPQNKPATSTGSPRPLPDPAKFASSPRHPAQSSRTDHFLASNPAPTRAAAHQTYAREVGASTQERDEEDQRRARDQEKTTAGGWASKTLLQREMELERQRQREWEQAQEETAAAARRPQSGQDAGVDGIGGGIGGRWDVSQWSGFAGGDNQNKGSQGIGAGRRQIVGPRPLPNLTDSPP